MNVHTFDEIAWAAGLFANRCTTGSSVILTRTSEGEGSITGSGGRLEYRNGCKRKPHWVWVALAYEAFEVLEILWPWLGERRRAQALAVAPFDAVVLGPLE